MENARADCGTTIALAPIGALAGTMFTHLVNEHETKFSFLNFVKYGAVVALPIIATTLFMLSLSVGVH